MPLRCGSIEREGAWGLKVAAVSAHTKRVNAVLHTVWFSRTKRQGSPPHEDHEHREDRARWSYLVISDYALKCIHPQRVSCTEGVREALQ